jgi:hypothetical protein
MRVPIVDLAWEFYAGPPAKVKPAEGRFCGEFIDAGLRLTFKAERIKVWEL